MPPQGKTQKPQAGGDDSGGRASAGSADNPPFSILKRPTSIESESNLQRWGHSHLWRQGEGGETFLRFQEISPQW